jgi:AcrR family transcriptional regulator
MSTDTKETPRRTRLGRAARERAIIGEATRFFAEIGLGGDMRTLAARLGVTQSLIYKFFDSKEALIERVYEEVFLSQWNPLWEEALEDQGVPFETRLRRFYAAYAEEILNYAWVRLYLFAGLAGLKFNRRYFDFVREHILVRVVREIRREMGLPSPEERPIDEGEIELVSGLHADIFYIGIRKWVYDMPVPDDLGALVASKVDAFVHGAPRVIADRLAGDAG